MDKIKVKRVVTQYEKNLSKVDVPGDKLNAEAGLSMFDQRKLKTEASHKPFSSMLTDYSRNN